MSYHHRHPLAPPGMNEFTRLLSENFDANHELSDAIVAAAPLAIFLVDKDGTIVLANEAAEPLFGYTHEELVGKCVDTLVPKPIQPKHRAYRDGYFAEPVVKNMGAGRDLNGLRKDGTEVPVEVGLRPLALEKGLFAIATVVDITERKSAEGKVAELNRQLQEKVEELALLNSELRVASDLAKEASRFKTQFLANMSHEIRTPMNAVIGMCNVLLSTALEQQQYTYAHNIKDASYSLLTVINEILDFSKIEAGKMELELVDFDLVRVVEGVCELLATQASAKKLSLMAFVEPGIPQLLRGDPERLRQVLINLTGNAIKFSDRGEVVVKATMQ